MINDGKQLFTRETREDTVAFIRDLVYEELTPVSDRETAMSYVFFDYSQNFVQSFLSDHGLAFEIENLSDTISFIRFVGKCDQRGRPDKNERLDELRELLREANIPFLTIFESNGVFQFPRMLIDSSAQYYFCEHSTGASHYYRTDLKQTFKSSWEANIARVLKYLDIPYEYEGHMLQRHDEDGTVTGVYIPDFWLSDNRIVEVKGFWDQDSRKKVLEIKKNYPQYKYYIIDQDVYASVSRQYCEKIPEWEKSKQKEESIAAQQLQVVGLSFGSRRQVVKSLDVGDPVMLYRDSGNPYDRDAVLVKTLDGNEIGFLSADWACIYAQKLDIGMEFSCSVVSKEAKRIIISALRKNLDDVILHSFLRE